jgi:glutathione synthase/RimK-type ligase-like ATP-grasp enzyme
MVNSRIKKNKVKSKSTIGRAKKFTRFRPRVRSKHPSYDILRGSLPLLPFRSIVRFGSTTELGDETSLGGKRVEINSPESIRNSASKFKMKELFIKAGIKTPAYVKYSNNITYSGLCTELDNDTIVAKTCFGSRGEGMKLIRSQQEFDSFIATTRNLSHYLFEPYFSGVREYRLHCTEDGCFYTCRKVLRSDVAEENRWYRNDSNCNWLMETNEGFDKPVNWDSIVAECVKALKALGLDMAGFDVRVQSATTSKGKVRENPDFIILESNSACSLGEVTAQKYLAEIPKVLTKKFNKK